MLPSKLEELELEDQQLKGSFFTWKLPISLKRLKISRHQSAGTIPSDWALPNGLAVSEGLLVSWTPRKASHQQHGSECCLICCPCFAGVRSVIEWS